MNNAVYGKTMENVRKRMDWELVTEPIRLSKCIASIYFKDRVIYRKTISTIHYLKKKVLLDKPTYVGMANLDISKTLMNDFHYGTMWTLTHDFCSDMQEFSHKLDASDYPKNHPLFSDTNKMLGMFKDEANAAIVTKFVGLRAKMYHIEYGGKTTKKAKGSENIGIRETDHF
ncbi:hypothetical protein B566_EDAN002472 [Ephemera danica]|nr:hypothetical protein B566_EDAN002472 [Ephemera danica]